MDYHRVCKIFFRAVLICSVWLFVAGNHFHGGTISSKPTGNGYEVEFNTKTGWVYRYCTPTVINNYTTSRSVQWRMYCSSGCLNGTVVNSLRPGIVCTGANEAQDWERGENVFTYTMPGPGPFTVEYTGVAWITAVGAGSWRIATTVDLRQRSDTGRPNNSPVVSSKPMYYIKHGCIGTIVLPLLDADDDTVKCRWAVGDECVSVCHNQGAASVATLDPDTCRVTINANGVVNDTYAVAIMIEDRPKTTITLDGATYTPNDVISSVPLQFLVQTPAIPTRSCDDTPIFVDPTPNEGDIIVVNRTDTLYLSIYAISVGARIESFVLLDPPPNVQQSAIRNDDLFRLDVYATDLIWTPTASDKGFNTLCVEATDNYLLSAQRCITVLAWDKDPCVDIPCQNNATCTRDGYTDDFSCACAPGYTGTLCEIEIPDPCLSDPCMNDGNCTRVGLTTSFDCTCVPGYSGQLCEIDIDECASTPCQNGATCFDLVNGYFCGCADGYNGTECEIDINECEAQPCENGGTCRDLVGTSVCDCMPGFTGVLCQTGIDQCASLPCENGGICEYHTVAGYTCTCVDGWLGKNCGYRFQNQTMSGERGMLNDHMSYSDCNCDFGNVRLDKCSKYRTGKSVGFGFLGVFLGILTVILLYVLLEGVFRRQLPCFHDKVDKVPTNKVEPEMKVSDLENDTEKPEGDNGEEVFHTYRHRKCYACPKGHNIDFSKPIWQR